MSQVNTQSDIILDILPDNSCEKYITESDSMLWGMEKGHKPKTDTWGFASRLRALRENAGLSQTELSALIKRIVGGDSNGNPKGTQSHVANLESLTQSKMPSVQILRALAIALETSTDYLLGLTDDDSPHGLLSDQVVVTVTDATERAMLQEAIELLARASSEDKEYIVALIRRLVPKKPRIIGDE